MPGKRSPMRQIREVLRLHHEAHLGERQIAAICLVGKGTVQRFLQRATAAGLRWPLPEDAATTPNWRSSCFLRCQHRPEPPRPPPDFTKVHQELKSDTQCHAATAVGGIQGTPARRAHYSWFCDQYRDWARHLDVVLRQDHRAGEKMFVDHAGDTIDVIHPATGEIPHRLHLRRGARRQQLHLRRSHLDAGSDGLDRLPYADAAVLPAVPRSWWCPISGGRV